jgi:hypothetical protein
MTAAEKPKFTTRHYRTVAEIIRRQPGRFTYARRHLDTLAASFALDFGQENELFDAKKFLEAAGVERDEEGYTP